MSKVESSDFTKRVTQGATMKCRIPLRISSARPRAALAVVPQTRVQQRVPIIKTSRPRSAESRSERNSTAGKSGRTGASPTHIPNKKQSLNCKNEAEKSKARYAYSQKLQRQRKMLNQDAIQKQEDLELQNDEHEDLDATVDVVRMKASWQDKIDQFERMKTELDQRQRNILEFYAILKSNQKTMNAMGQGVHLPSVNDLSIMNVAKLTPDQLLHLCAGTVPLLDANRTTKNHLGNQINMEKVLDMPSKLVATCEQTLNKRKEIIDWFQSFKSEEKGISTKLLTKKINEFSAENEMLHSALKTSKMEFLKDLNEIIDYLRRSVNEIVALQLRTQDLINKLADTTKENTDLKKILQSNEQLKLQNNKMKIEELKNDLKEEKSKRLMLRERLTRTEGQVRMNTERAAQLETALQLANSQNWKLERTVHELHEENQKLQADFDKELNKLTESIRENTMHLEEIGEARQKLQAEKEGLEQRLQELSDEYNKALAKGKEELNSNVEKLIVLEKSYKNEKEERRNVESKLQGVVGKLWEAELRHKDMVQQLQDQHDKISQLMRAKHELEVTKNDLNTAHAETEALRSRLAQESDSAKHIEESLKDMVNAEKNVRVELRSKEKYIAELEKKISLLEQQLHENNHKIECNDTQFKLLREQLDEVQMEFGKFDNVHQLREVLNQKRENLLEAARQNADLVDALQEKEHQLERHLAHLADQENALEEKDSIIKMLSEKEEEQANIIKLLRNNLEMRAHADSDLTQQLAEKNTEIDSLIVNIDTRKQQISQLEKIILALEDQLKKVHFQRRRDQEKMAKLEKAINEYENHPIGAKRSVDVPVENLDNLIKILENEVGTFFDPPENKQKGKSIPYERKRYEKAECPAEVLEYSVNHVERDKDKVVCKKLLEDNTKKTTCSYAHNVRESYLDRKRFVTKINPIKWLPNIEPIKVYTATADRDNDFTTKKEKVPQPPLVQLMLNQNEEKKSKMFKFAGHKL